MATIAKNFERQRYMNVKILVTITLELIMLAITNLASLHSSTKLKKQVAVDIYVNDPLHICRD